MNCSEFWKQYEVLGLTPGLEKHLNECKSCHHEFVIESELDKTIKSLHHFQAPDSAWESIKAALEEKPVKSTDSWLPGKRIRQFFKDRHPIIIQLKPATVGLAIIILAAVAVFNYSTTVLFTKDNTKLQAKAIRELENTEQKYLAAVDKFSRYIVDNKDVIDQQLYDLYGEKLALLDEYILQCKEAVSENEYNINARTYLALAYKEKAETLKEIAEKL